MKVDHSTERDKAISFLGAFGIAKLKTILGSLENSDREPSSAHWLLPKDV
jgi:hypothetical protein